MKMCAQLNNLLNKMTLSSLLSRHLNESMPIWKNGFEASLDNILMKYFLVIYWIVQMQPPPYTPDLAPHAFFFLNWNSSLRIWRTLKKYDGRASHHIKKEFQRWFSQWKNHWNMYVKCLGNYFEDIHYCLSKYSFRLDTFRMYLIHMIGLTTE